MPFIRSISGLRATLPESFTEDIAINYAKAFASILPAGDIVLGRDGRPSGEWIEKLVADALVLCGRNVRKLGICPTPTVQLFAEKTNAAGGIAVTASHNPEEWNGLKFINGQGVFLDASENAELWSVVDNSEFIVSNTIGTIERVENVNEFHFNSVSELINLIQSKNGKLKAVVDAVNASGSKIVPELLEKLGIETIELYCDSSGKFPHTPEPLAQNLTDLANAVKLHKADIGIAVDPDADRLVLIDENGEPIGEEKTITLAAWSVLKDTIEERRIVTVNHSTSMMVDSISDRFGGKIFRSPVGEINVVKEMKRNGSVIGGEGSGGVIYPASHYGRDSIVGIVLILKLMIEEGKTLSELSSAIKKFYMLKHKEELKCDLDALIPKIKKHFSTARIIEEDGIKIIWKEHWVQLRKSNTEPIIRIISEAGSIKKAEELLNEISKLIMND